MDVNECCTSINPVLTEEEVCKIKGDAIGDTLYSERWVLKILMRLVQMRDEDWNDEFEMTLCTFWDTTINKDVVYLLLDQNFLSIALKVLNVTEEIRLVEIMIGILGNMCSHERTKEELSKNEDLINVLIKYLESSNTPTLVQLIRLFHVIAWDLLKNTESATSHWLENELINTKLASHISFILKNCMNEELLYCVLEFLYTMCSLKINDKDFSLYFSRTDIVEGLIESWNQLFSALGHQDFPDKRSYQTAYYWMSVLESFTEHERGRVLLRNNGTTLGEILHQVITKEILFTEEFLIPLVSSLESLIGIYHNDDCLKIILKYLHNLYQLDIDQTDVDASLEISPISQCLRECIENYCCQLHNVMNKHTIHSILTRSNINENHVLLFWKVVSDREQEDISIGE